MCTQHLCEQYHLTSIKLMFGLIYSRTLTGSRWSSYTVWTRRVDLFSVNSKHLLRKKRSRYISIAILIVFMSLDLLLVKFLCEDLYGTLCLMVICLSPLIQRANHLGKQSFTCWKLGNNWFDIQELQLVGLTTKILALDVESVKAWTNKQIQVDDCCLRYI